MQPQPSLEAQHPAVIFEGKHGAYAKFEEVDPRSEAPPQRWRYREWWLFGFGILTLAINGSLAYVGWQGIRTANESIKQIQRQTATSEKTLVLQFRPKLVMRGLHASVDEADAGTLLFGYANTGSGPARLVGGYLRLTKTIGGVTEEVFQYDLITARAEAAAEWRTYPPGSSVEIVVRLPKTAANAIWTANQTPGDAIQALIVLAGQITYIDELGTARHTGIYRRYDSRSGRFLVIEDADLEYSD